jgi:hypothetical protein
MKALTTAPADKAALVGAYEELRGVGSSAGSTGRAWRFFMSRGLREWMNTCSSYLDAPATSVPVPPPHDETILPEAYAPNWW